jgi:hypothetical protein
VKCATHRLAVLHPKFAQGTHWRQVRESIVTKPLHTSTFVVYANQYIATNGFDIGTQLRELGSAFPIATK